MGYSYTKNIVYLKFKFNWMSHILSYNPAYGSTFHTENHCSRALGIKFNSELFKKGLTLIFVFFFFFLNILLVEKNPLKVSKISSCKFKKIVDHFFLN